MLRETTVSVGAGAIAGIALFLAFARLLANLLYDTSASDVRVMALAAAVMVAGALAAAWLQARHIATVSPTAPLRDST